MDIEDDLGIEDEEAYSIDLEGRVTDFEADDDLILDEQQQQLSLASVRRRAKKMCPGCTPKKLRKKRKTIGWAVALFTVGTAMIIAGIVLISEALTTIGVALVVIGALCFLPGSYASYLLYQALRGRKGYAIDDVPEL